MDDQFFIQNKVAIEAAKTWASMVQRKLRANTSSMNGNDSFVIKSGSKESKLSDSIRSRIGTTNEIISNISFSFSKHGVFVQKGVGRGYQTKDGFVTRTAKSDPPGQGDHILPYRKNDRMVERHPNDWFNSVIEDHIPELADKLVELHADAVFDSTKLLIK